MKHIKRANPPVLERRLAGQVADRLLAIRHMMQAKRN